MVRKKTPIEEYAGGFPPGMEAFEQLKDPRNGKTIRHSFDQGGSEKQHSSHQCLGQLMVDGKSNEITAVPKLLR